MDVSIIIVNYNTRKLSLQCLESIFKQTKNIEFEVIVVDNASSDGSCTAIINEFPQVIVIESEINLGFGKANNLGAKTAKGKYLLLLNSDCILIENTVKALYDFVELNNIDNSIGVVGVKLFDESMQQSYSYHRFPTFTTEFRSIFSVFLARISQKLFRYYENRTKTRPNEREEVECILGADLFIPNEVFKTLGGFDEHFFLYFEETDLQKRMADLRLDRIFLQNERIIHIGEGSSKRTSSSLKKWIFFVDSRFKYCKKHWIKIKYWIFYITILPFLFYPVFLRRYSRDDKKDYLRVLLRRPY